MDADSIPVVDPTDLEQFDQLEREVLPGYAIGEAIIKRRCPNSDIDALRKRLVLLKALAMTPEDTRKRLSPWLNSDGAWSSAAFRVAARFPMDWLQRKEFYVEEFEEFLKQVSAEEQ